MRIDTFDNNLRAEGVPEVDGGPQQFGSWL